MPCPLHVQVVQPMKSVPTQTSKVYHLQTSTSYHELLDPPPKTTTSYHELLDPPHKTSTSYHELLDLPPKTTTSYHKLLDLPPKTSTSYHELLDPSDLDYPPSTQITPSIPETTSPSIKSSHPISHDDSEDDL